MSDVAVEALLQCPACSGTVAATADGVACEACDETYDRRGGVYDLVRGADRAMDGLGDELAERVGEEGLEAVRSDYEAHVAEETREARRAAGAALAGRLDDLSGVVVDVATGFGGLVPALVDRDEVTPVATDASVETLRMLRDRIGADAAVYVACNARRLPIRDGVVDGVVTAGGFANVADPAVAVREARRVLADGGPLVALQPFVPPDSASAERAGELAVRAGFVREAFEATLSDAGFVDVTVEEAAAAEWTGNPYDELPLAGDVQRYALVEARA